MFSEYNVPVHKQHTQVFSLEYSCDYACRVTLNRKSVRLFDFESQLTRKHLDNSNNSNSSSGVNVLLRGALHGKFLTTFLMNLLIRRSYHLLKMTVIHIAYYLIPAYLLYNANTGKGSNTCVQIKYPQLKRLILNSQT